MACIAAILNTDGAPVDPVVFRTLMDVAPYSPATRASVTIAGCVGLGAVPLDPGSTMDGPQPHALGGRVSAVADVRLDDRDTLVATLQDVHGCSSLARMSDAELLVRAYEAWGIECVDHLTGDFAFCVWDARRQQLFCARDRFGVKPFYYAQVGRALLVGNALRGLRRHPAVSRRLHEGAIGDFLLFGLCVEPSQTPFTDVSRLPPGHRLVAPLTGDLRVERYWSLRPGEPERRDPKEDVERFSVLLERAVADRLRGDRVGVFMSGGLDSSSIASVAAEILGSASARERLHAFTVVYDRQEIDEEGRYSEMMARSIGIAQTRLAADEYEPFQRWDADGLPPEPSLEAMTAVTADLLDLASAHGSVVLSGDGGDPLLLPSSVLHHMGRVPAAGLAGDLWRAWRARAIPPLGFRSTLARWRRPPEPVPGWLSDDLLAVFDPIARWREVCARRTAEHGARGPARNEITDPWWASTFESLDPGATRRAVEPRYPFFDVRLVSFALTLPSFPWCLQKRILRTAMRGRLPDAVRSRPKTPLGVDPLGPRGQWSPADAVRLFNMTPDVRRFIDVDRFRSLVHNDSLLTGDSPGTWAAVSLAEWMRHEAGASR